MSSVATEEMSSVATEEMSSVATEEMSSGEMCKNVVSRGLNGVAMDRHGLILWENDATGLKIIFKYLAGPKNRLRN